MISDLIFGKGESGFERNPLIKQRTPLDFVAAYFSLFLAMVLIAAFRLQLIESSAAANCLLLIMVIYFLGELAARIDVLLKLAGLFLFSMAFFIYLLVSGGMDGLTKTLEITFEKFLIASLISVPVVIYFSTQRNTYHCKAALVACGLVSFIIWIAILMARGQLERIDPTGQLLFFGIWGVGLAMIFIPAVVESLFLRVGWPICTVTYTAIKESDGNFEHVLHTLTGVLSVAITIIVAGVALVVAWKTVGPGSSR